MKLKIKFSKKKIILSAVNLICISGAVFFSIVSNNQINSLTAQKGAERWQNGDDKNNYSQISCFFSDDSGMTKDTVNAIRSQIKTAMTNVSLTEEENSRLWIDTYTSNLGKIEVSGKKRGSAQTEITAVTSDFFLIHNFSFIDGSYFREEELSENGIVIDRNLAWQIFGSDSVKGMNVEINNTDFYISGVVDTPENDAEKKSYGNLPRAYISYEAAETILNSDFSISSKNDLTETLAINCYEAVIPNPVKNYAYNSINEYVSKQYENTSHTIENTGRFSLSNNFKRLRHLSNAVIIENSVSYTWWENAARVTEVKASLNLFAIICFLVIPFISILIILIRLIKYLKSKHIIKSLFNKIYRKIIKY